MKAETNEWLPWIITWIFFSIICFLICMTASPVNYSATQQSEISSGQPLTITWLWQPVAEGKYLGFRSDHTVVWKDGMETKNTWNGK